MTFIYALECPTSGAVRYIGKADRPEQRLKSHLHAARSGATKHATAIWLCELIAAGTPPVLRVLHEVRAGESWQLAEKAYIAAHRAAGADLTNSTTGGQGLQLLRAEDRAMVSSALTAAWNRPGAREHRSAIAKAACASPEARARRREAAARPEAKANHAAGLQTGLFGNPEVMARRRASQLVAAKDPQVIAAKAAASRERWADPAYRDRLIEKQKAAWIKRKERTASCTTAPDTLKP